MFHSDDEAMDEFSRDAGTLSESPEDPAICIKQGEVYLEKTTWEDSYAIARELKIAHPDANLEDVSLRMIYKWTIALPGFDDDPELANDAILSSIYKEWYEEVNPV